MHRDHEIFIQAIKTRKKILIQHRVENSTAASTKICCPLFYVPPSEKDGIGHYYLREDENGPLGSIVSIKADKIVRIGQTQEPFDPAGLTLINGEDVLE
jgi:hypothetical protein